MSCPIRTEGQEYVCSTCGVRWDFGDEQPECRRDHPRAAALPSWPPPSSRANLAARLRGALAMQQKHTVVLTSTLARDLIAELERIP